MPERYILQFIYPKINNNKEVALFDLKTNSFNIGTVKRISATTVRYIINDPKIVIDVYSNNNSVYKELDASFSYVESTVLTKAGSVVDKNITVYEAIYDIADSKVVMIEWLD